MASQLDGHEQLRSKEGDGRSNRSGVTTLRGYMGSNEIKTKRLGMSFGTAANRLRKLVLFDLAQRLGLDTCFRCSEKIKNSSEFSIDHTEGWELSENPRKNFFDLSKIAFSHLKCNVRAGTKVNSKKIMCSRGHPYSGENLVIGSKGHRRCKICERNRSRLSKRRSRLSGRGEKADTLL
jgi:hypothetical protein